MQEERGLSKPEQLRDMRQWAEAKGVKIVVEYDSTESAFQRRDKRSEFEKMLALARTEHVDMILGARSFSFLAGQRGRKGSRSPVAGGGN
jgi:DNA invertase Pin-like site-specific DNA recombinase